MQHRYQVIREGRADYSAQYQEPGDPRWIVIKSCVTKWGAIHACKKEARFKNRVDRSKNPVWSDTLPPPIDLS